MPCSAGGPFAWHSFMGTVVLTVELGVIWAWGCGESLVGGKKDGLLGTGVGSGSSHGFCSPPPELVYEDVFTVWETIWAAGQVSSPCYGLFIALALVEVYRDIILENNMDFTDIIKFFNGTSSTEEAF